MYSNGLTVPQNGPACPSKWPCLSLKMALPIPQNGPNVNVVIFFYIKKGFYYDSFLECFISV